MAHRIARRKIMLHQQAQRHIYYDPDLKIEAYNLIGIVQKFPNHFHECYVIGFVEGGCRHLWCKNEEYDLKAGDLILFNPRDNHYCAPLNGEHLDYRALNIDVDIMGQAAYEITGERYLPHFSSTVLRQSDITPALSKVYDAILNQAPAMEKEEAFFFLLEQLLTEYSVPACEASRAEPDRQIQKLCSYMEAHFAENITLDSLLDMCGYGKSYLLRSFTRQTGVSPYRYLQTIRLDRSKKLLEQGVPPIEAAAMTGFSDQSHFTNYFKEFIGLTPKQYQRIFTTTADTNETTNKDTISDRKGDLS